MTSHLLTFSSLCLVFYCLFSGILISSTRSVDTSPRVSGSTGALLYLSHYGYLDPSVSNPKTGNLLSEESYRKAILEFQAFANLNMTGELDEETVKMMNMPRCGVQDKVGYGANARRRKRYALQGSRWRVRNLTYKITKYPVELTKSEVDREILDAFKVWSDVTDLKFDPAASNEKVHIEIRFVGGEHGDGDPFDGPGATLAHAFFPIYGGDVHFDSSESWTVKSHRGTNLFQVASHEIGHSLGLSHSDVQSALMAPFYRGYTPSFRLNKDDVKAIQSLYGKNSEATPVEQATSPPETSGPASSGGSETSRPGSTEPKPAICSSPKFDAIVTMSDQKTYVFQGSKYYQLLDDRIAKGYPRSISDDFDGLAGDLDAAFTWTNGKTYFFKGDQYWRFTDLGLDESYPKSISKGFSGVPDSVDAAFVWSGNGKIYFFKGKEYWRFDPTQRPPVMETYPKHVSNWKGIPDNVDDALQYSNGYTYFFKDGEYWRFNDRAFRVDTAEPPFPRSADKWWFGCAENDVKQQSLKHNETSHALPGADDVPGDESFDATGSEEDSNRIDFFDRGFGAATSGGQPQKKFHHRQVFSQLQASSGSKVSSGGTDNILTDSGDGISSVAKMQNDCQQEYYNSPQGYSRSPHGESYDDYQRRKCLETQTNGADERRRYAQPFCLIVIIGSLLLVNR